MNIRRNKISGVAFAGLIAPSACKGSVVVTENLVRSAAIGWLILDENNECVSATSFTATFTTLGVGSIISASKIYISHFFLAENQLGLSLRTGKFDYTDEITFDFTDIWFVGETQHSYCYHCDDNDCVQRVGFRTTSSDWDETNVELVPGISLPVDDQVANANTRGQVDMTRIKLVNFHPNDKCKVENYGFTTNPLVSDYMFPHGLSNFKLINVSDKSLFFMNDPNSDWDDVNECGLDICRGLWNALIEDLDGSVIGHYGGAILPNNPGVAHQHLCKFSGVNNAYICRYKQDQKDYYAILIIDTFAPFPTHLVDRADLPVSITSFGHYGFKNVESGPFFNDLNYFRDHVFDGQPKSQQRLGRLVSLIYTGIRYNVTFQGEEDFDEFRVYLQGTRDRDRGISLMIDSDDDVVKTLELDGEIVPNIDEAERDYTRLPSLDDPHGTNKWYFRDSRLQFILRDEREVLLANSMPRWLVSRYGYGVPVFILNVLQLQDLGDIFASSLSNELWTVRIVDPLPEEKKYGYH